MLLNKRIKEVMKEHKKKIELFQWAVISGISSLLYSEYIKNMRQKQIPVRMVQIPSIKTVKRFLDPEGKFLQELSDQGIDRIYNHPLFRSYCKAPEFILFTNDHIEVLKTIFDLYIIPNIARRIPEVIIKKFDLDNPNQQLFRENNELDLFERKEIQEEQFAFIVEEIILQLLLLIPTMEKDIEIIEDNSKIYLCKDEILTIGNEKAICPILFNDAVLKNQLVMSLLTFVTSTCIESIGNPEVAPSKDNQKVDYKIITNPFNQVCITRLKGIHV